MTNTQITQLPSNHFYHDLMNHLLERLDYIRINPADILNYGFYTAQTHQQLQNRYPTATIVDQHDIIELNKLPSESIDFVFGHFPLLNNDPVMILQEFSRVLRNEGLLLFTSLGPDTFCELRKSFEAVDHFSHVNDFVDMHHIGDWLKALRLDDPVVDQETITIAYDDLSLFFRDLKQLRTSPFSKNHFRGLLTQHRWQHVLSQYQKLKIDDYYPVSIELIFGHAWKVKQQQQDEYIISIDQIRKK